MKFNRKRALCEGVNTFFGKYKTYIRAREQRIADDVVNELQTSKTYIRAREQRIL